MPTQDYSRISRKEIMQERVPGRLLMGMVVANLPVIVVLMIALR